MRDRQRRSRKVSERKGEPLRFPKLKPKHIVGLVATGVMLLLIYGGAIRRALTGHYNPRISFERGAQARARSAAHRTNESSSQEAVFDGEVYRTEGRLREASAVVIAATLSGVTRITEHRPVRTVDELLEEVAARGLLPPGVELVRERHLLVSEHSTIHVRFRPDPFGVEVVSLGRERADGPGLLLRVPDENTSPQANRQRYFYSFRLENITVPEAFANAAAIEAAGWQIDYVEAQLPDGTNAEQLAAWTRNLQQPVSQTSNENAR
jgi:hypothetical protein